MRKEYTKRRCRVLYALVMFRTKQALVSGFQLPALDAFACRSRGGSSLHMGRGEQCLKRHRHSSPGSSGIGLYVKSILCFDAKVRSFIVARSDIGCHVVVERCAKSLLGCINVKAPKASLNSFLNLTIPDRTIQCHPQTIQLRPAARCA